MKENTAAHRRKAYTLAEFAEFFGRHRSWAYRQARDGRIKTITGYGTEMVPSYEIDRILCSESMTTSTGKDGGFIPNGPKKSNAL